MIQLVGLVSQVLIADFNCALQKKILLQVCCLLALMNSSGMDFIVLRYSLRFLFLVFKFCANEVELS